MNFGPLQNVTVPATKETLAGTMQRLLRHGNAYHEKVALCWDAQHDFRDFNAL